MRMILMLGCLAILLATAQQVRAENWKPYKNDRFGTVLEVPSSLIQLPPPQNGDGRNWVSEEGNTELVVYAGYWNVQSESFTEYRQWYKQMMIERGASVTYEANDDGWFVLSGLFKQFVYYVRVNQSARCPSIAHTVELSYLKEEKSQYDPWAERLGRLLTESPTSPECP